MEPIRVLQFGMTSNPGGIESFIMNYYRNMDHKKIQFDFINMYGEIAYEDEILELGGRIFNIAFFKKNPIKNYYDIKALIKENNYNIIHVNMLSAAYILPLIAARKSGVECIIAHSHNSLTPPIKIKEIMNNLNKSKLKRNATHFFACSKLAGDWMFGDNGHKKKVYEIKNAIVASEYSYNSTVRKSTREKLNLEGKFVVGHVGRFNYQKNHDFLMEIFYEILKKEPQAVLLLVGQGELKELIRSKAKQLGIEKSVIFLGIRSDISDLMQAMDVFLFPSLFEGLGIVAIEAQAAGLPCVVADTIPKEAFITNLVTSIPLNKSANYWADKVLKSQNAYQRPNTYRKIVESGYDIESEVSWLENFYLKFKGGH